MLDLEIGGEPPLVTIPYDWRNRHIARAHNTQTKVVDAMIYQARN